jgi:hypothetical protein
VPKKAGTDTGREVANAWLSYTRSENKLRKIMALPNERVPILNRFGEFLYCQFFGGELQKLNNRGFDVLNRRKRIQVKTPRKKKGNYSGLSIDINKEDCGFDVLAVFWFNANSKICGYLELPAEELLDIFKERIEIDKPIEFPPPYRESLKAEFPELAKRWRRGWTKLQASAQKKGLGKLLES